MTRDGKDNGRGAEDATAERGPGPLVLLAQWVRAGLLRRLTPTERDTLMILAAFGSSEGRCFPAVSTITDLSGHTRGRIFKALRGLVSKNVLARGGNVKRRNRNAKGPVVYMFLAPPMGVSDGYVCATDTHEKDATGAMGVSEGHRVVSPADTGGVSARDTGGVSAADTQIGILNGIPKKRKTEMGGVGGNGTGAHSLAPPDGAASFAPAPGSHSEGEPQTALEGKDQTPEAFQIMVRDIATILGTVPTAIGPIDKNRTAELKRELFAKYPGGNNGSP